MNTVLHDIRYALRMLLKNPVFSLVAIAMLTLGIGANTAIFSLVNSILLKQLPFEQPERLVWVWSTRTDRDKAFYSIPNFIDTRDQNQTFEQVAVFGNWAANLTEHGEAERLQGVRISAGVFEMLGVKAEIGRTLLPADDQPDQPLVVVLSHNLWKRRFGGDPDLIGKNLRLNGDSFSVVGVLPPEFVIPNAEIEMAVPLKLESDPRRGERGSNFLRMLGRLKPGVSVEQAAVDLKEITSRLRDQYPGFNAKLTAPSVQPLEAEIAGSYRAALSILLAAVALVLTIACANLASLLLARAAGRQKEIAIRTALGATRWRIVRQLLTESLTLALVGGGLGFLLAVWGKDLLLAFSPADLPRAVEVTIDTRVALFSMFVSLLAGVVFGLAPALQSTKADLHAALKDSSRSTSGSAAQARSRTLLVLVEVTLSLTLLIGAGLLIRSFGRLQSVSAGFDHKNLLAARISLPSYRYSTPRALKVFHDKLTERLSEQPEVEAVGLVNVLPLSGLNVRTEFTLAAHPPRNPSDTPAAQNRWVSPGYFHTMKIPILEGRDFAESDNELSPGVVVVDESLAKLFIADETVLGTHLMISFGGEPPRDFEVVGVAGSVKHAGLNEEPLATLYAPIYQVPQTAVSFLANNLSVVVRSRVDSERVAAIVSSEVHAVDPEVPATNVKTMTQFLASSIAARRFNLLLLTVFAVAALLLASAGLYGVISFAVTQRSREIGIRRALGAKDSDVLTLIIKEGMKPAFGGIAFGLITALSLTRLIRGMLFAVSETDPATFAVIALLLAVVAMLACYIPARRATKVDPVVALRCE
jgi:putative ABC transport system permease protein